MNCEYSMGRAAAWRLPKLLNTDIRTTAITSHSSKFFVRLFKGDLYTSLRHSVGKKCSYSATPGRAFTALATRASRGFRAGKILREQIHLATFRARRARLARRHFLEMPAKISCQRVKPRPMKGLYEKGTARPQRALRKSDRTFRQRECARLIGGANPGDIGGHIRNYKIGRAAESLSQ